jgi:ribosomal protein L37AE/L43A
MSQRFIKREEDFICEVCGAKVKGNGYTDHCPLCLWSKHVDNFPGDRQNSCGGLMEPIGLTRKRGEWKIIYRCQACGQEKIVKAVSKDNLPLLYR